MNSIMDEESVLLREGEITQVIVNRPKSLNSLNLDVLASLSLIFKKISRSKTVKVVTLWGAGDKAFVAGADIPGMADLGQRAMADYLELGQRTMRLIENCHVPVLAAVNGYALGGGLELALACDIILASNSAKLGLPEVSLGIIPGFGGTQRLIERCGIGTTRRLVLTGDIVSAQHALQINLVDQVAEEGKLSDLIDTFTENILKRGPLALSKAKAVIRRYGEQALLAGLRHETESFLELFESADREEGMRAFMEKRSPEFKGK